MTAAKKTVKTAAKAAPAKKLVIAAKTGKIAVKKVDQKALDAALAHHTPIVVKAQPVKPTATPAKTMKKVETKKEGGPTKADKAREIFKKMAGKSRKDILNAFIADAGLTVAGAATYYSNLKKQK